jgi:hypothetical protein
MEHRCGTRYAQNARVIVETTLGMSATGVLSDVSVSGAFLRCPLPAPLHARVTVKLPLGSAGRRSAERVNAQVVRHGDDGFAIEWLEFSPPAVWELLNQSLEVSPTTHLAEDQAAPAPASTRGR